MRPSTIGLSTGIFYHRSLFEVLEPIRDSGFTDLEICSYPRHLDYHDHVAVHRAGEEIRRLGLRAYSFHAPFAPYIDITCSDPARRAAAVQELRTACRAAALMGVRHVVLHPGPEREGRPSDAEFMTCMKHAAASLNIIALYCQELGIHLLLENMLPHLLFGRVSDMLHLLGEITYCSVGTCLDTGHANLSGDLTTVVHKLSGHLQMLHVNDNHGDWDAHLVPGEGSIDWHKVISDLAANDFNGALILELSGHDGEDVHAALERARHSKAYLQHLLSLHTDRTAMSKVLT